jgi:hypothetical protein
MASAQQTAQRAWLLPLAASNTSSPLAIALALYPVQEVSYKFASLLLFQRY